MLCVSNDLGLVWLTCAVFSGRCDALNGGGQTVGTQYCVRAGHPGMYSE